MSRPKKSHYTDGKHVIWRGEMMLPDKTIPVKTSIMVVYENGVFRPLESVEGLYQEGDKIMVDVPFARERSRLKLGDLLEPIPDDEDVDDIDEKTLMAQLHSAFVAGTTLSDIVIEERGQGW